MRGLSVARKRIGQLGLGAAQFGLDYGISNKRGQVSRAGAAAIIDCAVAAGIATVDTAAAYGDAEEVLGETLQPDVPFRIITKTISLDHGVEAVVARAHRSLDLLARSSVDTLLVHSAADLARPTGPALWRALQDLRERGLFHKIGISAYMEDDPLALAERYDVQVIQLPLNFLDQRPLASGTIHELKLRGVEVHVRSLFLQGLIFVEPARLPVRLRHAADRLSVTHARIAKAGTTPLEAALAFVLGRPEIDKAIVGVTCASELEQIVRAAMLEPPNLDWSGLQLDDPLVLTPSLW